MDDVAERAFWMGIWRGILATLVFLIVMALYTASAASAFLAGANIALLYTFVMMLDAPRWHQPAAQFCLLRFAQTGAGIAIALCVFARLS
ncbi:MAG TPA: hypothetical protein VHA55_00560 [Pseudorhodoplanes sp.]|jgi:hypothetical protein|nr:hypothetical protein [Pseudorhodoplanes sp.]